MALQDIELAEEYYPKGMMHKLKERAARCFLAKKCYEEALKSFKYGAWYINVEPNLNFISVTHS